MLTRRLLSFICSSLTHSFYRALCSRRFKVCRPAARCWMQRVSDTRPSPVPSQARCCSHLRLPHRCHSLSSGNAPVALCLSPSAPSASSELGPAESTRSNDFRRGRSSGQQNERGWTVVRWSDVRLDRAGQAATNAARETGESDRSRAAASTAATASSLVSVLWATVRAQRNG